MNTNRRRTFSRFVPSHRQIGVNQKSVIKDVLLVLLGGVLAIGGTQFFFYSNRMTEAEVELRKEIYKEEYPILNMIVNFAYRSESTSQTWVDHKTRIAVTYGKRGEVIKKDTVFNAVENPRVIVMPSFAVDSNRRKELLEDFSHIKKSRSKISLNVWDKFEQLERYFKENPLPESGEYVDLIRSKWHNKDVVKTWDSLVKVLHMASTYRLNNPYMGDLQTLYRFDDE